MTASLHDLITGIRSAEPNGNGRGVNHYHIGMRSNPVQGRKPGSLLLWFAGLLLLALATAQGFVSWKAQYGFIFAAKHDHTASALEAIGLDTGAVIFALLGLAHARMGRSARIERTLNIACALGSAAMNVLASDLGSPRSVAVYVLPAVLYAACSDRLIATVGHAYGVQDPSLWRWLGTGLLYGLRAVVAFPSTALGLRRKLLAATPLPEAPNRAPVKAPAQALTTPPAGEPAQVTPVKTNPSPVKTRHSRPMKKGRGETKKAVLLRLYADHPAYGDRGKASAVATELAPLAKLQAGTARSYIYAELNGSSL
jgi:hypothetical protein